MPTGQLRMPWCTLPRRWACRRVTQDPPGVSEAQPGLNAVDVTTLATYLRGAKFAALAMSMRFPDAKESSKGIWGADGPLHRGTRGAPGVTRRPPKTIALRLIDDAGIPYDAMPYTLSDAEFSARAVAVRLGIPEDQIFKTLLAIGYRGPTFAVIPASGELDLKALARVRNERRMSMVPVGDLRGLTGYARGAVTVPGATHAYPVVLDESALLHERIAVSAGMKGLQVMVATESYRELVDATVAAVTR